MRKLVVLAIASAALIAGCRGGGDVEPEVFEPMPLVQVHEWAYADVGLPAEWSVTEELPGSFTVESQPGLSPGLGLEPGQVKITIGYLLYDPSLDIPLVEDRASTLERWDLELVESAETTMLGHPSEVIAADGEDFAVYEARVNTAPATALIFTAYVPPGDLPRYRPTFAAMIDTAVLKSLLAGE